MNLEVGIEKKEHTGWGDGGGGNDNGDDEDKIKGLRDLRTSLLKVLVRPFESEEALEATLVKAATGDLLVALFERKPWLSYHRTSTRRLRTNSKTLLSLWGYSLTTSKIHLQHSRSRDSGLGLLRIASMPQKCGRVNNTNLNERSDRALSATGT